MFRFIKKFKKLQAMFETLSISALASFNVATVMFVVFFIFAIFGMQFFGKIMLMERGLEDHANFSDFPNAMLTLFRVSTGDMWELVMYGTMIHEGNSDCSMERGDCGTPWAAFYFIIFVLVGGLLLINLFVAIVLEKFAESHLDETSQKIRTVDMWRSAWSYFDRTHSGKLPVRYFLAVILTAPQRFGFGETLLSGECCTDIFKSSRRPIRSTEDVKRDVDAFDLFARRRLILFLKRCEMLRTRIIGKKGGPWYVHYTDMINSITKLVLCCAENVHPPTQPPPRAAVSATGFCSMEEEESPSSSSCSSNEIIAWDVFKWMAAMIILRWWRRCRRRRKRKRLMVEKNLEEKEKGVSDDCDNTAGQQERKKQEDSQEKGRNGKKKQQKGGIKDLKDNKENSKIMHV